MNTNFKLTKKELINLINKFENIFITSKTKPTNYSFTAYGAFNMNDYFLYAINEKNLLLYVNEQNLINEDGTKLIYYTNHNWYEIINLDTKKSEPISLVLYDPHLTTTITKGYLINWLVPFLNEKEKKMEEIDKIKNGLINNFGFQAIKINSLLLKYFNNNNFGDYFKKGYARAMGCELIEIIKGND